MLKRVRIRVLDWAVRGFLVWMVWVGGEVMQALGRTMALAGFLPGRWLARCLAFVPEWDTHRRIQAFLSHPAGIRAMVQVLASFPAGGLVWDALRGRLAFGVFSGKRTIVPGGFKQGGSIMEEKRKILEMVASGKISPEEGVKLLEALEQPDRQAMSSTQQGKGKSLLIEVHDREDGDHVMVRLPLSLVRWAVKAGVGFKYLAARQVEDPEVRAQVERAFDALNELDFDQIVRDAEELGELVRVDSEDAQVVIRIA